MRWKIAKAKQSLSDVVQRATREPQFIDLRDKPIAAVLGVEEYDRYLTWKKAEKVQTIADALHELRQIVDAESYTLEIPARADRENAILAKGEPLKSGVAEGEPPRPAESKKKRVRRAR